MKPQHYLAAALIASIAFVQPTEAYQELKTYRNFVAPTPVGEKWAIFDVDNTLVHPTQQLGSHQWFDLLREYFIEQGMLESMAADYQHKLFQKAQPGLNVQVVEPHLYKTLQDLKAKGYKVFALTARNTVNTQDTLRQLRSVGIEFDSTAPVFENIAATGLIVEKGVVHANGVNKGLIFEKLYQATQIKPQHMIFFDDKDYNVKNMDQSMLSLPQVQYQGYRYGGVDWKVEQLDPAQTIQEFLIWEQAGFRAEFSDIKVSPVIEVLKIAEMFLKAREPYTYVKNCKAKDRFVFICHGEKEVGGGYYDSIELVPFELNLSYDVTYEVYRLVSVKEI